MTCLPWRSHSNRHGDRLADSRRRPAGHPGDPLVICVEDGRAARRERLDELGHSLGEEELVVAFGRFKDLCDVQKVVSQAEILALIAGLRGSAAVS